MGRYNTKQKEEIAEVIMNSSDESFSADEIIENLKNRGVQVGRSTVYRMISELYENGLLARFRMEDGGSYRYQLLGRNNCSEHLHLGCVICGKTIHLECDLADEFEKHLVNNHGFYLLKKDSVISGVCEKCKGKEVK